MREIAQQALSRGLVMNEEEEFFLSGMVKFPMKKVWRMATTNEMVGVLRSIIGKLIPKLRGIFDGKIQQTGVTVLGGCSKMNAGPMGELNREYWRDEARKKYLVFDRSQWLELFPK